MLDSLAGLFADFFVSSVSSEFSKSLERMFVLFSRCPSRFASLHFASKESGTRTICEDDVAPQAAVAREIIGFRKLVKQYGR